MSTLLEIKTEAASYLNVAVSALTQNGVDLFLKAANRAVRQAELNHDFEFNRRRVTVSVNGTTGGDLGAAIDATSTVREVKTVLEAGLLDEQLNLIPVDWTTTAESLERQRGDNGYFIPRYPTDGWARATPGGVSRFTFSGDNIYRWPMTPDSEVVTFTLNLEAYCFTAPWTAGSLLGDTATVTGTLSPDLTGTYTKNGVYDNHALYRIDTDALSGGTINWDDTQWVIADNTGTDKFAKAALDTESPAGSFPPIGPATGTATVTVTAGTSDLWTTHGEQYLLWETIIQLNKLFMRFVQRQEGVLPPPTELSAEGLQSLLDWDNNKYEQFRRHGR